MKRRARASIFILTGCLIVMFAGNAAAQQASLSAGFSLAKWQSVNVGNYTLSYSGLAAGWPSYQIYSQGAFIAGFPPNPLPPNWGQYSYQNISIVTTGVASDGSAVTGTLTITP